MPSHTYTHAEDTFIVQNASKLSFSEMGHQIGGLTKGQVRGRYLRLREKFLQWMHDHSVETPPAEAPVEIGDAVTIDEKSDGMELLVLSPRVTTADEAVAKGQIDLGIWEQDRCLVNSWEVGAKVPGVGIAVCPLWQVKVWFKRRRAMDLERCKAEMLAEMAAAAPTYPPLPAVPVPSRPHMMELAMMDLHFGKLAWHAETGEDYDLQIAEARFEEAVDRAIALTAAYPLEKILLPIGNDLLHVDNLENTTQMGTRQDVDSRLHKIFVTCREMIVRNIDKLQQLAPVELVVIPGNHDKTTTFFLGDSLYCWYNKCDRVTVDNRPLGRKYIAYGKVLLGFAHGKDERLNELPQLMAIEEPKLWGDAQYRHWHIGHVHKKKEVRHTAGDTHLGVAVQTCSSLSGTDAWHYDHGYVKSPKAANVFMWDPDEGGVAQFDIRPRK
jgi:hypothetical protein